MKAVPLPPPSAPRARPPGALDRIDESFLRLRLAPLNVLGIYYAGSLPFVLALLYFWTDMRRNPDAARDATGASLAMAALFLGMKVAQAVFAARLRERFTRQPDARWTWARLGRIALVQTLIQPSGLFLLPLAAVVTVPLGWVYAFYANVTVLGDGGTDSARTVIARSARGALRDPKGNHAALMILSLLGMVAWMNLVIATLLLPQLARMFTGEENVFTRSGLHILNSTFFAVTFALVYLALDPLAKTFYALRCFHADAQRSGEDLTSALRALPALAATIVAAVLLLLSASPATAAPTPPPPATPVVKNTVSAPALGHSVEDVLRRREFAWRAPRPPAPPSPGQAGPVRRFFDGIRDWIKQGMDRVGRWVSVARGWVRRWLHSRDDPTDREPGAGGLDPATVRGVLYALIAGCVGALGWLVWKSRRGRRAGMLAGRSASDDPRATPDLADEGVLASQLPEDEWLRLAQDLTARGERRLALRAYYLSTLAGLGARGLLAVARHKSNRDYLGELRRRARDRAAALEAFARNVGRFERVWYGPHPADDALLAEFRADRERVLGNGV